MWWRDWTWTNTKTFRQKTWVSCSTNIFIYIHSLGLWQIFNTIFSLNSPQEKMKLWANYTPRGKASDIEHQREKTSSSWQHVTEEIKHRKQTLKSEMRRTGPEPLNIEHFRSRAAQSQRPLAREEGHSTSFFLGRIIAVIHLDLTFIWTAEYLYDLLDIVLLVWFMNERCLLCEELDSLNGRSLKCIFNDIKLISCFLWTLCLRKPLIIDLISV